MTFDPRELANRRGYTVKAVFVMRLGCGCIVAVDDGLVIFERDDCTNRAHIAGRRIPDDEAYAYLRELGDPVA